MSAAHKGKESGWLASPAAGLDGVAGQVSRKFHADPVGNLLFWKPLLTHNGLLTLQISWDRRVIPPEDRPRAPGPQSHYKSGVTGAVSSIKGLGQAALK